MKNTHERQYYLTVLIELLLKNYIKAIFSKTKQKNSTNNKTKIKHNYLL